MYIFHQRFPTNPCWSPHYIKIQNRHLVTETEKKKTRSIRLCVRVFVPELDDGITDHLFSIWLHKHTSSVQFQYLNYELLWSRQRIVQMCNELCHGNITWDEDSFDWVNHWILKQRTTMIKINPSGFFTTIWRIYQFIYILINNFAAKIKSKTFWLS